MIQPLVRGVPQAYVRPQVVRVQRLSRDGVERADFFQVRRDRDAFVRVPRRRDDRVAEHLERELAAEAVRGVLSSVVASSRRGEKLFHDGPIVPRELIRHRRRRRAP
eukprot:30306-Pelagococcus_subviridis.AAC.2